MKLHDPTTPFADVIARRRRERAASDSECFRLGGRPPASEPRPSNGPIAVVGASDWALDAARAERTLAHIGALGGLLADLGYDVYAVSSLAGLDRRPSFVGWVGGDETPVEHEQLVALDAQGLTVGAVVDGIESWGSVEPDEHRGSIEFVRAALQEIRRLTDPDEPSTGDPSHPRDPAAGGAGPVPPAQPGEPMPTIELRADLNSEDDEGRWWSLLRNAVDPSRIVPGAVVVAGTEQYWAQVRIDQVDDDGQVHFVAVPDDDPTAASASTATSTVPPDTEQSRRARAGRKPTQARSSEAQ